jgi:hypothetical protein
MQVERMVGDRGDLSSAKHHPWRVVSLLGVVWVGRDTVLLPRLARLCKVAHAHTSVAHTRRHGRRGRGRPGQGQQSALHPCLWRARPAALPLHRAHRARLCGGKRYTPPAHPVPTRAALAHRPTDPRDLVLSAKIPRACRPRLQLPLSASRRRRRRRWAARGKSATLGCSTRLRSCACTAI